MYIASYRDSDPKAAEIGSAQLILQPTDRQSDKLPVKAKASGFDGFASVLIQLFDGRIIMRIFDHETKAG